MSRRQKILAIAAASIAGLLVVAGITSYLILQSSWFANFVRQKVIATTEESTGGKAEIGRFDIDLAHLTVRIHDFVLHGTEPGTVAPLLHVSLLELRLKLFSGILHTIDLAYLGVEQPQVNLITFPDGRTNIPEPKNPKPASGGNPLQTVVDLKVGQFNLQNGLIQYLQQKSQFSGRGEDLRVLLNYNSLSPSYQGNLSFDPLSLRSGARPPLVWRVNVPVTIENNAIRVAYATLSTARSKIAVSASLQNTNAPVIDAKLNANVVLEELARSFDLPIHPEAPGAPRQLNAEIAVHTDDQSKSIQIRTAHLGLGDTTFQASGTLRDANNSNVAVSFNASLALAQLEQLLNVKSPQAAGALLLNGSGHLDAQNNYKVDGTLNARDLSIRQGANRLADVQLYSPFHADPYLVSLDGLKLSALGGSLAAKVFLESMQKLSVEGTLNHFSIPVLAAVATGKKLGYDGTLNGSLRAVGDLKAKGASGYSAQAHLAVSPGGQGVPLSGRVNAIYSGARDIVDLEDSYLALPHSRIDFSGALNRRLQLTLTSSNLNDFLPAANFGETEPKATLPVVLQGGTAAIQAEVTGNLSDPRLAGHVSMNRFAVQNTLFDSLALDVAAAPSGAAISNGQLTRDAFHGSFDASIGLRQWSPQPQSPVTANLTVRNASVTDLLAMAGESTVDATGTLGVDGHIHGVYGNPLGAVTVQITGGSAYQQKFNRVYAQVNLADQLITLQTLEVASDAGTVDVNASYRHPRDSFMTGEAMVHVTTPAPIDLAKVTPLQQRSKGAAGILRLTADAAANVRSSKTSNSVDISKITADLSALGLRVQNQSAGDLTLTARTQSRNVNYQLKSNFAGSNVDVTGHTALSEDYPTTASASIRDLSVGKVLSITGQGTLPISGTLSAEASVNGTIKDPKADLSFTLSRANVYQEAINRLNGSVHYTSTLLDVPALDLDTPAGNVKLNASFRHPVNSFDSGTMTLKVNSTEIDLAKIEHLHQAESTLSGSVHLAVDVAADATKRGGATSFLISRLNSNLNTSQLELNHRSLGDASFDAQTEGSNLNFRFDSDIAQSQIHLKGQSRLSPDYPTQAKLTFANIKYSNIAPFVSEEPTVKPSFEALVEGQATVNGPLLNADALNGQLELTRLSFSTNPYPSPAGGVPGRSVTIANEGPVVVDYGKTELAVRQLHLRGPSTSVDVSGGVNLKNESAPMDLHANANLDLAILQSVSREFYSSGAISLDAAIHGSLSQPLVNGKVELKNANVNYTASPNGLSNGNGTILLTGTGATIQNLTGESGGGKVSVTGFAGWTGRGVTYNLKAAADRVRVRYSGISATSTASITLIGNSNRSLLGGTVTVQRIAYGSSSDTGSLLSSFASQPPSTPSAPSPLLTGMRLNIHILTSPDLHVATTYANRLSVEANLTIRGTASTPGILGRVTVTDGQLVFFGNTYTVTTGNVNFYNPTAIEPVVNISLETLAQGVDVTLGVSGPVNNLQLSYRSDPPLSFEQIVQLLATNTTPSDPNVVASQPQAPEQSFTQMGESAVLGQAVANPLASRVQRVFGLSQFKIDPSVAGNNGQPSARVTLQQKIANNITFTYITDVTQTNSEIVRVQWDLTPKLSAVGLRDFNGNVSIQAFYKFKIR